jgi:hypothetical protein
MSRFVLEALFIGAKEGLLAALCVFLARAYLKNAQYEYLQRPLLAALGTVFLASFVVMTFEVTAEARDAIVKMIGYVFGLFYFFSVGALFHATGTDLLGPLAKAAEKRSVLLPLTFVLTVLYFVPDMAGSSLYVADLSSMANGSRLIIAAAGAGFALSLAAGYGLIRLGKIDLSRLFGLPQLLLALALIKLLTGGVRGFAEMSLIPAVQTGLKKLIHDVVHQTFVMLMVPDHPILSKTTWNFIGVLFGESVGLWLSLILLALPMALFVWKHFGEPESVPASLAVPARRRIFIKALRDQRVMKSIPVFIFLICIVSVWFVQKGTGRSDLYLPDARTVTAEGGVVMIPLQTPLEDLRDGAIHKFKIEIEGEEIRLLIMKKPDGTLSTCLDACEICAPDGYGQAKEHVVCIYCKTPIPFDTVGKPGGCNPIPLPALVTDKEVRIEVTDMTEKWALMKSGQAKGGKE